VLVPKVSRDFVGYGERPLAGCWPGASKVAVSLVLNIEDGAERSTASGDEVDDLNAHWVKHSASAGERNLSLESAFDYGARAGIWRVLRTLREFNAPCTAFCCAEALVANPLISAALVRDGHEIANHGLKWNTHTDLDKRAEREQIRRSSQTILAMTGQAPVSWYSRDGISSWTLENLLAESYSYDSNSFCDDSPYSVTSGGRSMTVVPYAGDTNDSGLLNVFPTGRAFGEYLCDALEMLRSESRGATVMSVGLHPRLIGRPGLINGLRSFLREARKSNAWIAPRSEIAGYWKAHIVGDKEANLPQP
jgi:allantoinase